LFNQSRILLSTSRWESGPIVAAEAVLRGCSVVGAQSIPGFRQFSDTGCGTVFATHSPRAIASAVREEARAWRDGRRDPEVIAAAWRGYFTPRQVCAQLLGSLMAAGSDWPDDHPGLAAVALDSRLEA
jgi:hypothetical protein